MGYIPSENEKIRETEKDGELASNHGQNVANG